VKPEADVKRRSFVAALFATAATVPIIAACTTHDTAHPITTARTPHLQARTVTTAHASSTPSPTQESSLRIAITIDGQTFHATLTNSQASQDLVEQLPQTLEMRDHGGVEKTGRLRAPLSLQGQPRGADPAIGDVGYYAPGQDFVLYYGDQSYYDGIVVLGQMEDGAAERLRRVAGSVTAHIESGHD
jgi:hypothetical protein